MSRDIQVPSLVSKSISCVCPRAFVVSHSAGGFSWADAHAGARSAAAKSQARKRTKPSELRSWATVCMMTLRDDLLERADAHRVWPANSIAKIAPSIPVRALYHVGATKATLSRKCATFVSLRNAFED